jgi:hypothetical protein
MSAFQSHGSRQNLPLLDINQVNTENGISVVNRTKRFVLNIPKLPEGGELLVSPDGIVMKYQPEIDLENDQELIYKQEQVFKRNKHTQEIISAHPDVLPERGIVFRNEADQCWQAVRGNGKECILFTDVDATLAEVFKEFVDISGLNENPSIEVINQILNYASSLGMNDRQNKKASDVANEMKVIDQNNPFHMIVTKEVVHKAVLIPYGFIADTKRKQSYASGAVILDGGKHKWPIATDVFMRNFKEVSSGVERDLTTVEEEFRLS